MCISTMRFPAKSFRIDFPERTLRKYEVTLTGLKGMELIMEL